MSAMDTSVPAKFCCHQNGDQEGIVQFRIIEGKLLKKDIHIRRSFNASADHDLLQHEPAVTPSNDKNLQNSAQTADDHASRSGQSRAMLTGENSVAGNILRDSYIRDRIFASAGPPLNVENLKNRLKILLEDPNIKTITPELKPNIKTINAELKPGKFPDESELDLTIAERNPFQFGVRYSNDRSPSVGAYHLDLLASDSDLTGNGDTLSARWSVVEGAADTQKYSGEDDFGELLSKVVDDR